MVRQVLRTVTGKRCDGGPRVARRSREPRDIFEYHKSKKKLAHLDPGVERRSRAGGGSAWREGGGEGGGGRGEVMHHYN